MLTDGGAAALTITADQLTQVANALPAVSGNYALTVTGESALGAQAAGTLTHVASLAVADTAANVSSNIDGLESLAAAGKLTGITLSDAGIPSLSITPTQLVNDSTALKLISGSYTLNENASAANLTITGATGVANTIDFTGTASQYSVASTGNDTLTVTDVGTGRTSVDHLSNVQALQFSDHTVLVAAAPTATGVTTGNVTELYGAVFGREPDVAGLAFYQNYAAANPNTPLLQFAQWFLASAEYTGNAAHTYAQTVAGDQQFITDSYQNLLGRAPSAAETAFYENKVIAPALSGLSAGTAAYAAADAAAHAQTLVYFSASTEFLGDVQVTSTSPASSAHWLVLI